jgi:hypothetical protein
MKIIKSVSRAQSFPNYLPLQILAQGLLADVFSERYHIPFTPDRPYPATLGLNSHSNFDRNVHVPQGSPGTDYEANYDFWMGLQPPPATGSVSVFPEQRGMMNSTQRPITRAQPRSTYIYDGLTEADGGAFLSRNAGDTPHCEGSTPAHTFPSAVSNPLLSDLGRPTQSPSSTFPPYPHASSSTPISISRASYQALKRQPSSPASPRQRGATSSSKPPEQPAPHPVPPEICPGQEKCVRTLRSVRTRFGDVYAEHESGTDRAGGRWVCQCGSTFVRDSDWERHAMHSLSHSAGGGFDCNICDISFTRSDAMFRHRRKKHGDSKPIPPGTEGGG